MEVIMRSGWIFREDPIKEGSNSLVDLQNALESSSLILFPILVHLELE